MENASCCFVSSQWIIFHPNWVCFLLLPKTSGVIQRSCQQQQQQKQQWGQQSLVSSLSSYFKFQNVGHKNVCHFPQNVCLFFLFSSFIPQRFFYFPICKISDSVTSLKSLLSRRTKGCAVSCRMLSRKLNAF